MKKSTACFLLAIIMFVIFFPIIYQDIFNLLIPGACVIAGLLALLVDYIEKKSKIERRKAERKAWEQSHIRHGRFR